MTAMDQSSRGAPLSWIAVDKETFSGRVLEKPGAHEHPDRRAGTAGRRALLEVRRDRALLRRSITGEACEASPVEQVSRTVRLT